MGERYTNSQSSKTRLASHAIEQNFPQLKLKGVIRIWRIISAPILRGRGFARHAHSLLEEDLIKNTPTNWLAVSFGYTSQLLRFWKLLGYYPLCISPKINR